MCVGFLFLLPGCEGFGAPSPQRFDVRPNIAPAHCRLPIPDFSPSAEAPQVRLAGAAVEYLATGTPYVDPGATALDAEEGDVTTSLEVTGLSWLNVERPGDYWLAYSASDAEGHQDVPAARIVRVGEPPARLTRRTFAQTGAVLEYLEHLPVDYGKEPEARYPLIVYFHGWGHSKDFGDSTLGLMDDVSMAQVLRGDGWDESQPFVVLLPQQCWNGVASAEIHLEHAFIEWAQRVYRIDGNRIYIAGLSAGGWAAWEYVRLYPNEVAAAVPMAAGGRSDLACGFKDVPIWGFHAEDDDVVPVNDMLTMIEALDACNPPPAQRPRLTVYASGGHVVDDETFDQSALGTGLPEYDAYDPDIFTWLLSHQRRR